MSAVTGVIAALEGELRQSSGSDLALDLPQRLLNEEFGPGAVMRFEDVDFPRALTHEPTRRFLKDVGLPEDGFVFQLDTDVPLPTLAEYYADDRLGAPADGVLPERASQLIRLGRLAEGTDLVVDGSTGAVLGWRVRDATPRPLDAEISAADISTVDISTADISTLVWTLWLMHRHHRGRRPQQVMSGAVVTSSSSSRRAKCRSISGSVAGPPATSCSRS
ncbi:SUKH-4 family immunity protein [Streptomyces jeddahensis]